VLRVTNPYRWKRTKISVAVIFFFIGLACIGGLEAEGTEPFPSIEGALFSLAIVGLLTYNIIKKEGEIR
jgi:hypothetical protein